MSGATKRNIVIAVVLLVLLLVEPFWGSIKSAVTGEDGETGASPEQNWCSVTITCADARNHMDLLSEESARLVPDDGVLLPETEVAVEPEGTVLDALLAVTREYGIAADYSGTPAYLEGIGGLYAGDAGDVSGWTYSVNGEDAMVSCAEYTVSEGDKIVWSYVCTWDE